MPVVAGYYRVSQARDGMKSPELYENEIRRYCEYRSLELGRIFFDLDMSGYKDSEKRPALAQLVSRRSEFSAVIVPKLSRFGRSLKHLTQLFDSFDSDGIALVFLDLGMDTSTSQGRLLRHIMAAFAEYESDVRGDYTRANHRMMALRGEPFGRAPFGYIKEVRTFVPDPARADVVRGIFSAYVGGATQSAIARDFFARGIETETGKIFPPRGIGRMLDNYSYAGLLLVDGEFVTGNWEPLIDRATWDEVQARRASNRTRWARPRGERRLLARLIYCGDCGRLATYVTGGGKRPPRYRCGHGDVPHVCRAGGINAHKAEAFVTDAYLERARYLLARGHGSTFIAERQWEFSSREERRMLLVAAIERVVILPLPPGQSRPGSPGRSLQIVWKDEVERVEPVPVNHHGRASGRATRMALAQLTQDKERAAARSEARRSYYDEWRDVRQRLWDK